MLYKQKHQQKPKQRNLQKEPKTKETRKTPARTQKRCQRRETRTKQKQVTFHKGRKTANRKSYDVISRRPSTDRTFPSLYHHFEPGHTHPRLSNSSDIKGGSFESCTGQSMEDFEATMRGLKLQLKQTMMFFGDPRKAALTGKQKATEFDQWKTVVAQKLEAAKMAEEAAISMADKERAKALAEAQKKIAELEAQKGVSAEMQALKESQEKRKALDALAKSDFRYRKYSIEEIKVATEYFAKNRKIGEGGYGPVYKGYLDHTAVAIKVFRPDAAQGSSQFQKEIEVLSRIRHPNIVLLLGACPEYGCLVYEYITNGSLDDHLFCRGNTLVLSWQLRFRIAAEIATGLLFLHQTKPEPLVHRNLKPGNILLDRNYVSKISDVGLARLVPPSIENNVTQSRMTLTPGGFCYIGPEYQHIGMIGLKSNIYSLGIMLLQLVTAKNPMNLAHHVERRIEQGTFAKMLDPAIPNWPVEDALNYAKLALRCAYINRRNRPDLGKEVLPELNRLRSLAEESMPNLQCSDGSPNLSRSLHRGSRMVMSDGEIVQGAAQAEHHIQKDGV